jgi:hypothetical protein
MIDLNRQIVGLAVHIDKKLVEVPPPLSDLTKRLGSVFLDLSGHQATESVPPEAYNSVNDIGPALAQQILHVSKRKWKPGIHHHGQADDFERSSGIAKWVVNCPRSTPNPISSDLI